MNPSRMRHPPNAVATVSASPPKMKPDSARPGNSSRIHPGGAIKHGAVTQGLRMLAFFVYFMGSCLAITVTQIIGAPLYFYSKDVFYAWMAMTKQHFGVVCTTMTYWWAPVKIRVSGDKSVKGQMRLTEDGRLECDFPERMVLIANHQIYTDWVYLWWIAYTSKMHGHLYIILKESIKYIPILGVGMMFYGFIFLSRKWATDKVRFQYRLRKLSAHHSGPMSGQNYLDPMWLLIFPEGTNLSPNGRVSSAKWAEKNNMPDLRHAMLPRSTGLLFCLQELEKTVDYMYDCTVAYEGVPRGQYGQDLFTLRSTYFQGRSPKSINFHWRRFAIKDIPIHDEKLFADWLLARWREKDDLLEEYLQNGRFPADDGYLETEVKPSNPLEFLQYFAPLAASALVINVLLKIWYMVLRTLRLK